VRIINLRDGDVIASVMAVPVSEEEEQEVTENEVAVEASTEAAPATE
jgi:hypothetical protein